MPISVKDIQEKEFSRQKRDGYNIEEVDDFLDEISDQLSVLIRENMALAEQVKALAGREREARSQRQRARARRGACPRAHPRAGGGRFQRRAGLRRAELLQKTSS